MEPAEFSKRCTGVQGLFFLCLHPQGCLRRSVRALGSFNSGPGNGVFPHVATPTRQRLQFPRETGFILRCTGKVGNPFQTKQGNRPSCCDQEGRRGSDDVVPGTLVFPSSEAGMSGNFRGAIMGAKYRFALQSEHGTCFEML